MPISFPNRWLPGTALCGALLLGTPPALAGDDFLAQAYTPDTLHQRLLDQTLTRLAPDADPRVLRLAARALSCADPDAERLAVIDFSLPSTEPRLWVFDLQRRQLLFEELVSHGQGSGNAMAETFSNVPESHQSSIGLFRTMNSYQGRNGYSLRLEGLEPGVNHLAYERAIVIHGADYVSEAFIEQTGRLGRSHGCPAVRQEVAAPLIDSIKEDQYLFTYYPDPEWLASSDFFHCDRDEAQLALN
ncbi:murein L,D-transpeptidase catalytic domain family protein [Halomonas sp. CKK8]|uniref:murein L,D-transpeptidase catalytic domain family protein n=1 Tax=Halomonas sp. CKK8 TaxID=3036127 RepID=UPI0024158C4D|nr:murein L,D-transpeptidase catalytic domain family protein [Halomonas sp. CKK8]WFM70436.1 murein L,D-transpeptidase catalytic domain family protein [Halomonas sp. CKK8]